MPQSAHYSSTVRTLTSQNVSTFGRIQPPLLSAIAVSCTCPTLLSGCIALRLPTAPRPFQPIICSRRRPPSAHVHERAGIGQLLPTLLRQHPGFRPRGFATNNRLSTRKDPYYQTLTSSNGCPLLAASLAPLGRQGGPHSYSRFGRRWQNNDLVPPSSWRSRDNHPNDWLQRGNSGLQKHQVSSVGLGRPNIDPAVLAVLLCQHRCHHLRGGLVRSRPHGRESRRARGHVGGGGVEGRGLVGHGQQAGHGGRIESCSGQRAVGVGQF